MRWTKRYFRRLSSGFLTFLSNTDDPFNLQRFLDAQRGINERGERELCAGRKETHWMWFIFRQIKGLGHSAMTHKYAPSSAAEVKAYLDHPLLGPATPGSSRRSRRHMYPSASQRAPGFGLSLTC